MPIDPWFDDDGNMDFEEVQEDVSFAADILGVGQRSKANKQREKANKQRETANKLAKEHLDLSKQQGEEANRLAKEHLELVQDEAKTQEYERERKRKEQRWKGQLPNCENCGHKIPTRGVDMCGTCGTTLTWIEVDRKDYLPPEVPAAKKRLEKRLASEAKERAEQREREARTLNVKKKREALGRRDQDVREAVQQHVAKGDIDAALELARVLSPSKESAQLIAELEAKAALSEKLHRRKQRQEDVEKYGLKTVLRWEKENETSWLQLFSVFAVLSYPLFLIYRLIVWLGFLSLPDWYTDLPTLVHYCFWLYPIPIFALIGWLSNEDDPVLSLEERRQQAINAADQAEILAWIKQCPKDRYYIRRDKTVKGPLTAAQIVDFAQNKRLKSTDEVKSDNSKFILLTKVYSEIKKMANQ
jgi:hypothetical protein